MTFQQLQLDPSLLRAVKDAGYESPSPIQVKAIPKVLSGSDLLACAQTGTGKTAAFALPILQHLAFAPAQPSALRLPRALILTPTRELALQIHESFLQYGKYSKLRCAVVYGGVGLAPQVQQLKRGIDILTATPGRLNDLIGQGFVKLSAIQVFVLDEADRMLDMGFVQDVKKVVRLLPQKRQTLLFSATMPSEIVKLADSLLHQPAKVFVTPPATTVQAIRQQVYFVDKAGKRLLLAQLLKKQSITSVLVFTRTKHGADRVVKELKRENVNALAIHGNKSQTARQSALAQLKSGAIKVLVATDIAARGLDINELSHVINYDLPNIPETYVHRIGRTGRAGHTGIALSFCSPDERPFLLDIEKLIGFALPKAAPQLPEKAASSPENAISGKNQPEKTLGQKPPLQKPVKNGQIQKTAAGKSPAEKTRLQKSRVPQKTGRHTPAAGATPQHAQATAPQESLPRHAPAQAKAVGSTASAAGHLPVQPAGKNIVTKRPVWAGTQVQSPATAATNTSEGENTMPQYSRRRKAEKQAPQQKPAQAPAAGAAEKTGADIPKNQRGVFQFSDTELAQDDSLRLIDATTDANKPKYANFEDYLKNR